MPQDFQGRYFDGKSAEAAPAVVIFETGGLFIETAAQAFSWSYADVTILDSQPGECRLGVQSEPDAVLVLPAAARDALATFAPDSHGRHAGARRFAGAVAIMIAAAACIGAILFFGVPAASGPLAQATSKGFERRIGANMAAQIQTVFRRCASDQSLAVMTPVLEQMAADGDVGFETIHFNIVRTSAPNAFALPGGQVMATSGLVDALGDDQEAFLAVMAHELGHVRNRDGLRAFYRNAGLGLLLEVVTGGSGLAQQAVLIAGQLTQLRHTRDQETAADDAAYEIMVRAGLDPAALARAFDAITASATENDDRDDGDPNRRRVPNWLKTHPDTAERIAKANTRAAPSGDLPLSEAEWAIVRKACAQTDSAPTTDENAQSARIRDYAAAAPRNQIRHVLSVESRGRALDSLFMRGALST